MKTIALIALATALGLTCVGVAIPADVKEKAQDVKQQAKEKTETAKDKLQSAAEKTKAPPVIFSLIFSLASTRRAAPDPSR
jgi:hypothetical protein